MYDATTKRFLGRPPAFITAGRINLIHHVFKNDHLIPWNTLSGVLNEVLSGKADLGVVNALLSLSPAKTAEMLVGFKAGVSQIIAGKVPTAGQIVSLDAVELEIFSLPCNLAQGLNTRADDPGGDCMDYTVNDVDYRGVCYKTDAGELQKLRETLFHHLSARPIDLTGVQLACRALVQKITKQRLHIATPGDYGHWHPGPAPAGPAFPARTNPPYRYWTKLSGDALSAAEILTMLQMITARAIKG